MAPKNMKDLSKEEIEKNLMQEDPAISLDPQVVVAKTMPKMMDIIFTNHRDPGVALRFHYSSKTHPIHHYVLVPGQKYTLPEEVVHHLHGELEYDLHACHEPVHGMRRDLEGVNQSYIKDYKQLFTCKPCRA